MSDPDKARADAAVAVKAMRDNLPFLGEYHEVVGKALRIKYLGLVAAGFTEAQALDLCKEWKA